MHFTEAADRPAVAAVFAVAAVAAAAIVDLIVGVVLSTDLIIDSFDKILDWSGCFVEPVKEHQLPAELLDLSGYPSVAAESVLDFLTGSVVD